MPRCDEAPHGAPHQCLAPMCPLEEPRRAKEDAQGSAKECQDDLPRSPKMCLNDAHSSPSAAPRQATSSQGVPNSPAA
ncbi:hypothetical protein U1Q18_011083 [Sarracenia purpurea var. burkii]